MRGTYYTELRAVLERQGFGLRECDVGAHWRPDRRWHYVNADFTRGANQKPFFDDPNNWHAVTWLRREYQSLGTFLRCTDDATYIVNTPGHWAIASGGQWCETFTRGEWVAKRGAPKQTRRVLRAWQIERV